MLKNGSVIGNVNNPTRVSTRGLWDNNDVFLGAKSGIWPAPAVFSSFTFTNGTNTGPNGPTSANLLAAYDTVNNPFLTDTEIFTVSNGIQVLRLTTTGVYRIEAYGAEGGAGTTGGDASGKGAIMKGDFSLTKGDTLYILVGQQGQTMGYAPGGGGGTFVATGASVSTATALIVAGGGGGGGDSGGNGLNATTSTSGVNGQGGVSNGAGGTSGNGGSGSNGGWGESGAGFLTNSTSTRTTYGSTFSTGINSFRNGGAGSGPWPAFNGASCAGGGGGFGGGGAGGCNGGGGGGGYSGGGGGNGGGGSINSGSNQANTTGHIGHGKVIITKL